MLVCHTLTCSSQPFTYSFNSFSLLLGHTDSLSAGGQSGIVVSIFAKQVQELIRVCTNQLSQLRVAGTELLQDWLQHLRLLLNDLTELLELGVAAQKVEVTKTTLSSRGSGGTGTSSGTSTSTSKRTSNRSRTSSTTRTASALLCCEIEEVETTVITTLSSRLSSRLCGDGWCLSWLGRLLLSSLRDSLNRSLSASSNYSWRYWKCPYVQKVFDCAVRIKESSAHSSIDLRPFKSHGLHVRNDLLSGSSHSH